MIIDILVLELHKYENVNVHLFQFYINLYIKSELVKHYIRNKTSANVQNKLRE